MLGDADIVNLNACIGSNMGYLTKDGFDMVERQIECDNLNSLMAFDMRENTTNEKEKKKLTAYINKTQKSIKTQQRGLMKGYLSESNKPSIDSFNESVKLRQ